jgi:hypothetical protein
MKRAGWGLRRSWRAEQARAAALRAGQKKFCSEWGIESKGLRNCMHKHGDNLTHACVAALVKSGEVSHAEVERRKKAQ